MDGWMCVFTNLENRKKGQPYTRIFLLQINERRETLSRHAYNVTHPQKTGTRTFCRYDMNH